MVLVHGGGAKGLEAGVLDAVLDVLDAVPDVSFSRPRQGVMGQITTELKTNCSRWFICLYILFFL